MTQLQHPRAGWRIALAALAVLALPAAHAAGYPEHPVTVVVPYPPPPARVEIVPPAPGEREVWVDGQWIWRGSHWVWQAGGWQVPPADSYYAPPVTLRQQDGSLAYFEGGWRKRARRQ